MTFRQFVMHGPMFMMGPSKRKFPFQITPQMHWLYNCNEIIYYEDLDDQFYNWSAKVLHEGLTLYPCNSSHRPVSYREPYYLQDGEVLDQQLVDKVASVFKRDIEAFGYTF